MFSLKFNALELCSIFFVFAVSPFCFTSNADAQQAEESFAEVLKSEAVDLSDTSINEILEIRRRLGGGTGLGSDSKQSAAEDSKVAPAPSAVETESDSKPANRQLGALSLRTESILDHKKPDPNDAITPSERMFFEMLEETKPLHVGREFVKTGDRSSNIRDTARLADQLAADLEDLEMYSKADSLRNLASQIRRTARQNARTASAQRKIR